MTDPVVPLLAEHITKGFDCGVSSLNDYLIRYAWQNHNRYHSARTYVVADERQLVAYYTLAYGSVSKETAPAPVGRGVGHYLVPVLVLGRLAVDQHQQGRGLGRTLMRDAILRAAEASQTARLRAILVHAQNEGVRPFYMQYGFEVSPQEPLTLFLSIEDILQYVRGPHGA